MRLASAAACAASTCEAQQLRGGFVIVQARSFGDDIGRYPIREWRFVDAMTSVRRVRLAQSGDVRRRQVWCRARQSRPESPVHESDFSSNDAADEHIRRFAHGARERKNAFRTPMRPPACADRFAGDRRSERGNMRMFRRFGDDAMALDERERLSGSQDFLRRSCCHNTSPWPDARASTRAMTNNKSERRLR